MKCSIYDIEIRNDGWAQCTDLKPPESIGGRKRALREHREMEKQMIAKGLKGWIAGTDIDNSLVIGLFLGLGAKPYFCNGEEIVFFKELKNEEKEGKDTDTSPGNGSGGSANSEPGTDDGPAGADRRSGGTETS